MFSITIFILNFWEPRYFESNTIQSKYSKEFHNFKQTYKIEYPIGIAKIFVETSLCSHTFMSIFLEMPSTRELIHVFSAANELYQLRLHRQTNWRVEKRTQRRWYYEKWRLCLWMGMQGRNPSFGRDIALKWLFDNGAPHGQEMFRHFDGIQNFLEVLRKMCPDITQGNYWFLISPNIEILDISNQDLQNWRSPAGE